MMKHNISLFTRAEQLFTREELEETLATDSTFFVEYVETVWLDRYFKTLALSNTTTIPSINSVISDTPSSPSNEFNSKTENYALKSVLANEWVNHFHEKLNVLPDEFRDIVTEKYLKRSSDGRLPDDITVYEKLNLSRASYYRKKKEALEELGRLLYAYEMNVSR